jgi:type IV secretion system protein VirD4
MPRRYPPRRPAVGAGGDGGLLEELALGVASVVVGFGAVCWAAGEVAGRLASGAWPGTRASEMGGVLLRLAARPEDPAAAWPARVRGSLPGPLGFWALVIGLVGCGLLAVLGARALWTRSLQSRPTRPVGAWARMGDLRRLRIRRPSAGRLTLGRAAGSLLAAEPGQSVLVLGPTQSMKTTGLAIPAILEWEGPVVATSVKTDLVRETRGWRDGVGPVWVYDPTATTGIQGALWSPLAGCGTWQGALRTAARLANHAEDDSRSLSDADFWHAAAAKLLAPLLFAAATAGLEMADVLRWLDRQEEREPARALRAAGEPAALDAHQANFAREVRQRGSIFTTAETVLRAFEDPAVAASAAGCEVDVEALVSSRGGRDRTLYLCAPSHEQRRLRPLFATLVGQVLAAAYELAARRGGALPRPLLVVLDEAANIAPLRDLDTLASTAAGNGIQLISVFQDLAQVSARYGERAWTVANNHRAKVLLSGVADPTTLDYVSRLVGEAEERQVAETEDESGARSRTESPVRRRLAPAEALRQIAPGEGVLVYGHLPPARLRLRPWFADHTLRRRAAAADSAPRRRQAPAAAPAAGATAPVVDPTGQDSAPPKATLAPVIASSAPRRDEPPDLGAPSAPRDDAAAPPGAGERLVGAAAAARVLRVGRSTVQGWWSRGELAFVEIETGDRRQRAVPVTALAQRMQLSVEQVERLLDQSPATRATSEGVDRGASR